MDGAAQRVADNRKFGEFGAPGWIRTSDLPLRRRLL